MTYVSSSPEHTKQVVLLDAALSYVSLRLKHASPEVLDALSFNLTDPFDTKVVESSLQSDPNVSTVFQDLCEATDQSVADPVKVKGILQFVGRTYPVSEPSDVVQDLLASYLDFITCGDLSVRFSGAITVSTLGLFAGNRDTAALSKTRFTPLHMPWTKYRSAQISIPPGPPSSSRMVRSDSVKMFHSNRLKDAGISERSLTPGQDSSLTLLLGPASWMNSHHGKENIELVGQTHLAWKPSHRLPKGSDGDVELLWNYGDNYWSDTPCLCSTCVEKAQAGKLREKEPPKRPSMQEVGELLPFDDASHEESSTMIDLGFTAEHATGHGADCLIWYCNSRVKCQRCSSSGDLCLIAEVQVDKTMSDNLGSQYQYEPCYGCRRSHATCSITTPRRADPTPRVPDNTAVIDAPSGTVFSRPNPRSRASPSSANDSGNDDQESIASHIDVLPDNQPPDDASNVGSTLTTPRGNLVDRSLLPEQSGYGEGSGRAADWAISQASIPRYDDTTVYALVKRNRVLTRRWLSCKAELEECKSEWAKEKAELAKYKGESEHIVGNVESLKRQGRAGSHKDVSRNPKRRKGKGAQSH